LGIKVADVISPTKLLLRKIRIWESILGVASPFGSLRDRKSDFIGISIGLSKTELLYWELLGASMVIYAAQDEVDLGSLGADSITVRLYSPCLPGVFVLPYSTLVSPVRGLLPSFG
jgi:hypothetical protein